MALGCQSAKASDAWPQRIVNDEDDDGDDDGANPLQWLAGETIQSNRKGLVGSSYPIKLQA